MRKALVNGVECALYEDERVPEGSGPDGYPHRYETRHPETDMSIPATIESGPVVVNFFGTLFSKNPMPLADGVANVRSLLVEDGPSFETMEGVCPDCGAWLDYDAATVSAGTLSAKVSCRGCGFSGVERHEICGILSGKDNLSELPHDDPAIGSVWAATLSDVEEEAERHDWYKVGDHQNGSVTVEVPLESGRLCSVVFLTSYDETSKGATA